MNPHQTRVALIQMRCGTEPDKNFARAVELIRDAAKQGAQIVCLPELFRSQYFCQTEDHKNFELAEEVPGKSTSALGDVARETGVVIIASLFEKRSAGLYHNTAAIIAADGKLVGKYRKMHIPDDPLYHEKFYFTRRPRLSNLPHKVRRHRHARLLGSMVSRSCPHHGSEGRTDSFLPNSHRLAPEREETFWQETVRRMDDNSTFARHRQRLLCRRAKPSRARRHSRILGGLIRLRPVRRDHRPGQPRQG